MTTCTNGGLIIGTLLYKSDQVYSQTSVKARKNTDKPVSKAHYLYMINMNTVRCTVMEGMVPGSHITIRETK